MEYSSKDKKCLDCYFTSKYQIWKKVIDFLLSYGPYCEQRYDA